MSNESEEIDLDCRCTSKKMQEFYYWKYCRELYLESLKNNTFDITKDGNYAEYFLRKYILGKFYYDQMSNFNKRVALKMKQPKYASYFSDKSQKINSGFNLNDFQFLINPTKIRIESFVNFEITERNIKDAESYCYKVMNDENRPKEYNDETLGLIAKFSFMPLNYDYNSHLYHYVNPNRRDTSKQIFTISVSNFKDNEGKIYQVISLILNASNPYNIQLDPMIVFYYTPKDHPTYNTDISSNFNYLNFMQHDVDCLLNNTILIITNNNEHRIHLYRCDKPIFDENQLKILRSYSFIENKSRIETNKETSKRYSYNNSYSDRKSETRKYCESLLKKKYPNLSSIEISSQMLTDYPMYTPSYFEYRQESEDINSLSTQADKQLFFSVILKVLNNIENNIPTNSFKQDKSYLSDSFVSSRDALIPLYDKDPTSQNKMFICDNTKNYTMILNKMLFDVTKIDDLH